MYHCYYMVSKVCFSAPGTAESVFLTLRGVKNYVIDIVWWKNCIADGEQVQTVVGGAELAGQTALHAAALGGHDVVADILLSNGAKVTEASRRFGQ